MYRLILVDDEPQIRKGLLSLIPWEEYGIEVIGEADDGLRALDFVAQHKPDFAVVDIQLPYMDGISFLRELKQRNIPTKCIVLSGYDQYEYVRQAMRLGAQNYLLKPVNPEELKTAITDMVDSLEEERKQRQQFDESIEILRNNTLNRVLHNQIEVRELREKCQLLEITLRCNRMVVAVLQPQEKAAKQRTRNELMQLLKACNEKLSEHVTAYPLLDSENNLAFIIKNDLTEHSEEQLNDIVQGCADYLLQEHDLSCLIGLGTNATSYKDLAPSYQAACWSIDFQLIWGNKTQQSENLEFISQQRQPSIKVETMIELLQRCDDAVLYNWIHAYFQQVVPRNTNSAPLLIKYYVVELAICTLQAAHTLCVVEEDLIRLKETSFEKIRSASTIKEMEQISFELLQAVYLQAQGLNMDQYSPRIKYAVQHIHRNYNDTNLSLKTLAQKMDVNSAYLGRQFKSETGRFFSDYLNMIRVQRARLLINTTQLHLAEIAEQVGFVSVSYFSEVYKKITGERPGKSRSSVDS